MARKIKTFVFWLFSVFCPDVAPKVVFYHDIGCARTPMGTSSDIFWAHMRCLRDGDVICFDDGFRGVWEEREEFVRIKHIERLEKIVFLVVGLVGRPNYLTWNEILTLQNEYGFEFQCHTWSHQTLAGPWNDEVPVPVNGRTEEWYKHELVDSKTELERRLGRTITSLCLPVGQFSNDVIRRCRAAGYEKVYASYPGNVTESYVQPRCLAQDLSVAALKAVLRGGMAPFRSRYLARHFT